jgi:hypothetical protein
MSDPHQRPHYALSKFEKLYLWSQYLIFVAAALAGTIGVLTLIFLNRSVVAAKKATRAAIAANKLARENAAIELRAYVSVRAEHGDAVTLVGDPKTKETRVLISFYNAGQTPAHNFRNAFATGGVSKSTGRFDRGDDIERYRTVGTGPFSGLIAGGGGLDIPARSTYTDYLPTEQMPTEKEWREIENGRKPLFTIWGNYQYCDEFGGYHCRMLSFRYQTSPRSGFVPSSFTDMDCHTPPVVPPKEPAPVKVLTRCAQPEEEDSAQAYADSNAGKVFPGHPEMMGKPTPAAAPSPAK